MYVLVKDLPDVLQSALKDRGYGGKDIAVETRETVDISDCGGAGRRAFAVLINLSTGETHVEMGSWGGPNMFNRQNVVDNDNRQHMLPLNGAVILGSEGEKVRARVILHPKNVLPLLQPKEDVSDREKRILAVFGGYKPSYRKEVLSDMKVEQTEIDGLISRGYLKKDGRGISITIEGKNARGNTFV